MTDQTHNVDQNSQQSVLTGIVAELVGDTKKFKTVEDLAKGKLESDSFIGKLQDENKTLRTLLDQATNTNDRQTLLEKLMTDLNNQNNLQNDTNTNQPGDKSNQSPSLSIDDIVKLMDEREAQRIANANTAVAVSELKKVHGEKTDEFLATKAQELGISVEHLMGLAKTSPKAFLNTVGHSSTSNGRTTVTGANSQAVLNSTTPNGSVRNKAYYDNLQKEMGTLKFVMDKHLQVQLHKDMAALGDGWD